MTYQEIKEKCKQGKTGMIPGWKGYLDWDYSKDQLFFHNNDYIMEEKELCSRIENRQDLFYII